MKFKSVEIIIQKGSKVWRHYHNGVVGPDLQKEIEEILSKYQMKSVGPFSIKNEDRKIIAGVVKPARRL